jgi:beta-lactamase superfamily II metal-dependent hydrolase
VLFTGDIDHAPQQWLIENEDLTAEVLVLPHHGAVVANTHEFLEAVDANWLVRSSFVRDRESPELAAVAGDTPVLNTADVGAVIVRLGQAGVIVEGFQGNARSP